MWYDMTLCDKIQCSTTCSRGAVEKAVEKW